LDARFAGKKPKNAISVLAIEGCSVLTAKPSQVRRQMEDRTYFRCHFESMKSPV
jgi:hypothetical protein